MSTRPSHSGETLDAEPDTEFDAVLVGSGGGSLVAAIRLAERGLRPLIVEKSSLIGGGTAYSGGVVWVPNNHRMRAKGLEDSTAEALQYLDAIAMGRGDPVVADAYVRNASRLIDWLEDRTYLRWVTWPKHPDYFSELPGGKDEGRFLLPHPDLISDALDEAEQRWPQLSYVRRSVHLVGIEDAWVAGRALIACLWLRVLELGIEYRLDSRVRSLLRRADGTIDGVVVETADGEQRIRARHGVLLNTGGFDHNQEMTARFLPVKEVFVQTPPSNEGDGHIMAAEIGAALGLLDQSIWMPSIRIPGEEHDGAPLYRMFFQEMALPHSFIVNRQGKRFCNETFYLDIARGWSELDLPHGAYPNIPSWFVFDAEYRDTYGLPPGVPLGAVLTEHETLAELAEATGIDPDGLLEQAEDFNKDAVLGLDPAFNRGSTRYQKYFGDPSHTPNPTIGVVRTPPFYALPLYPGSSGHRGGVLIDADGRVLDVRGNAINQLYACGNTAASVLVGAGYTSGVTIGHSMVFGLLAAEDMIRQHEDRPAP